MWHAASPLSVLIKNRGSESWLEGTAWQILASFCIATVEVQTTINQFHEPLPTKLLCTRRINDPSCSRIIFLYPWCPLFCLLPILQLNDYLHLRQYRDLLLTYTPLFRPRLFLSRVEHLQNCNLKNRLYSLLVLVEKCMRRGPWKANCILNGNHNFEGGIDLDITGVFPLLVATLWAFLYCRL